MTIGDVLELGGIAALATASLLWLGLPLMCLAIGLGLLYLAQCYNVPLPQFHLPEFHFPKLRRKGQPDAND